jgi:Protein of unknown function (DUF3038)
MFPIQMMPAANAKWGELALDSEIDSSQLEQISARLDLAIVALVALTQISDREMMVAATDLQLETAVAQWINRSSPTGFARVEVIPAPSSERTDTHSEHSGEHRNFDLEQAQAMVSVISHLAHQHHTLIRRNITYWEQTIEYRQSPQKSPSLAEYIDSFTRGYGRRMPAASDITPERMSETALNLLVELLFYGSANGRQRLWNAMIQRSPQTT